MPSAAEITDLLDRLVVAVYRQRAAAAATRPDVNATDLVALDVVRRHPGLSPGRLAREMHFTPGGTNGVLRRVLRAKMVTRAVSPDDRQDVRLTITRRGEALMTTGVGGWDQAMLEDLCRRADVAELVVLVLMLAEATEQRADALAAVAARVNDPAHGVLRPVQWG